MFFLKKNNLLNFINNSLITIPSKLKIYCLCNFIFLSLFFLLTVSFRWYEINLYLWFGFLFTNLICFFFYLLKLCIIELKLEKISKISYQTIIFFIHFILYAVILFFNSEKILFFFIFFIAYFIQLLLFVFVSFIKS